MADPTEVIDAGIDGRQSRRQGKDEDDNPHPTGTSEWNAWRREWRAEDRYIGRFGE